MNLGDPKPKTGHKPEEIVKAEEMMTPEQKAASEKRALFMFQDNDPFEDFLEHIDQNGKRRPPTPEEKKRMDTNLVKLGKIFSESDVRWHLDGAMNISLMKGEYIGIHKDIDISVEQEDIQKLDEQLGRNGYGLFLHYPKDPKNPEGKKILERVGAKKFIEAPAAHRTIAAIDEQGKVRKGENLNFIDVHIISRNERGKQIGRSGIELPARWSETQTILFQDQEINLCHPAEIAYFKLHDIRSYDKTDLHKLAETGKLTLEDIHEIELAFEQEALVPWTLLNRVAEKISPKMSASEIFNVFMEEPTVAKSIEQTRELLKILSQKIEAGNKSKDNIVRLAFETFDINPEVLTKEAEEQKRKIQELKSWVSRRI
jgi:hypothetical protein